MNLSLSDGYRVMRLNNAPLKAVPLKGEGITTLIVRLSLYLA